MLIAVQCPVLTLASTFQRRVMRVALTRGARDGTRKGQLSSVTGALQCGCCQPLEGTTAVTVREGRAIFTDLFAYTEPGTTRPVCGNPSTSALRHVRYDATSLPVLTPCMVVSGLGYRLSFSAGRQARSGALLQTGTVFHVSLAMSGLAR